MGSLFADAHGDLFGMTISGGSNGVGIVFEIVKTSTGYAATPITLVSFNGSNGANLRRPDCRCFLTQQDHEPLPARAA